MYRCIHCGMFTGETVAEVHENYENEHGLGKCTSPCHWCNEGVKHSAHVCANTRKDAGKWYDPHPPMVRIFNW